MGGKVSGDLDTRIREASDELGREFEGRASPEVVARCVEAARALVAEAKVTDFAPIFFARHARRLLREATHALPNGT